VSKIDPTGGERSTTKELKSGFRIEVAVSAGPKLAGKHGIVMGRGTTKNQVRVLLDGSKGPLTLHARFVTPILQPATISVKTPSLSAD
jgi:hypothetical protein